MPSVINLSEIPYFDGHCDTIWRCMYGEPAVCGGLRENNGHVDLLRGSRYGRRAQFFALYDDAAALPSGTAWPHLCQMHQWFTQQLAESADLTVLCRTGGGVDAAVSSGRAAALLSIEGADLLDCKAEKI